MEALKGQDCILLSHGNGIVSYNQVISVPMDQPDELSDTASSKSLQSKINFFKTLEKQPKAQGAKTPIPSKGASKVKPSYRESPKKATSKLKKESFWSLPIFESPVCFISTEEDGKLQLHEDILGQIEQIEAPLVVIGIAGLYRTGKSYLMNCLAGQSKGFALGNTIQSKTKGIWAWCRQHPRQEDTVLFLLDTEGLGDIGKTLDQVAQYAKIPDQIANQKVEKSSCEKK